MSDEEIIEVVSALKANDKTMKDSGISDNLWGKAVECIMFLQSENAALRERLEKAITPEFKIYEDIYFIDYVNEKGYSDYTTGKLKIREAFITCVSQTSQTEFLYRLQPKDLPQEILNDSTIHDEWWNWRSFYAKEIFKTRKAAEARLAELKGDK